MYGSNKFDDDIASVWDYKHSADQYVAVGGTGTSSVVRQLRDLRRWLSAWNVEWNVSGGGDGGGSGGGGGDDSAQ